MVKKLNLGYEDESDFYLLDDEWNYSKPFMGSQILTETVTLYDAGLDGEEELDEVDFADENTQIDALGTSPAGKELGGSSLGKGRFPRIQFGGGGATEDPEDLETIQMIEEVVITVAPYSETVKVKSDEKYDYLKTELGMNILVPKGRIEVLRFKINFDETEEVIIIDGFPNDVINDKSRLEGKVNVGLNNAFRFIPYLGNIAADMIQIEVFKDFKLGTYQELEVDFSGGMSNFAEWLIKSQYLKNQLKVALTIKMDKKIQELNANVIALWEFNPMTGARKLKVGKDGKKVKIY